jgi:hypothetical protein
MTKEEKKAREIASMFFQTFSTEPGQFVMDRLKQITVERPVLTATSTRFGAGIREGQNDIVRQIEAQIRFAKGD